MPAVAEEIVYLLKRLLISNQLHLEILTFYLHLPQDVIAYSIVPKPPTTDFFYLHPETGVLSLAKPLTLMKETINYEVCTIFYQACLNETF